MASSGVEIASSAPFGCVLRDRNHRDVCRESSKVKATHVAFQRNIKNFVMDHFNTSFSMSDSSTTNENNINSNRNSSSNNNNNNNESQMNNNNLAKIRLTRNNHKYDVNNNNSKGGKDESDLASMISPKHSRLLDRWAARQAREMVSTLQNEAELLSMDNNNIIPASSETSSIISDECSSEISNLGASSLVQLWEKRLNNSSGTKPSTPMEKTSTNDGTTNATCNNENVFVVEEQRGLELVECFEGQLSGNEESFSISSFPDWESDKTGDQSRSCSRDQSRWCSAESEKVSVAEIIKKLTVTSQMQSPPPYFADENDHEVGGSSTRASSPCRDFVQELPDQRAFPQVTCLLRIRGRQAYNNLLMQLVKDRQGELKNLAERGTVSKFAQRGRIQALLRLKLLQRGVAANKLLQKSTPSDVNRQVQPHGSAIVQLREKFSTTVEQKSTVKTEVANTRNPPKETVNNITQLENSSIAAQISKDTSSQVPHGTASHSFESTQKSVSQTREEDGPSSNVMSQEKCFEAQHDYFKETAEPATSMTDSNANEKAEEENNQQCDETSYDCALEDEGSNQNYAECSYEEEMVEEFYYENNHDWIREISRPRSYWEEKRQAWYREILDSGSKNKDIEVLLQGRTVSTFLSSDFREKMDRMLQSHKGTQTHLVNTYDDDEDNEGLMAFFLERLHSARTSQENGIDRTVDKEKERVNEEDEEEEEEEDEDTDDDDDDDDDDDNDDDDDDDEAEEEEHKEEPGEKSLASSLYHEVGDYSNQSSPWSYRDNEAGDDFDRVASTCSLPFQSPSFYQDSRRNSPPTNHHSIEMDIIYDMRGHMEQIHQEMTELRKSVKSCLDMQMEMQLQQSNNQNVKTVEKEEKKSQNKTGKKGNCCICYEKKVDSVLYRCGHMCACLKCANELQWNSGKCPICQAKIDDVVRVFVDA